MKIFLASIGGLKNAFLAGEIEPGECNILESFYSIQDWQTKYLYQFRSFLLDSGAFTFLNSQSKGSRVDFERYADAYADYVKANKIEQYFELDIDGIVGIKEVERLRRRIELRADRQCIPVWHRGRGKDYFISMCKEYPYVAIGGIVTKEASKSSFEKAFPWLINVAHENGAKLHALGYTNLSGLKRFHFDSVDSSTWLMGNRFGQVMQYKEGHIIKHNSVESGVKVRSIKDPNYAAVHNFKQWVYYSKYAETNL